MTRKMVLGTTLILVTGCAEIQNETLSTITLNGREYPLRTRTISGPDGSYVQHSVKAQGTYRSCLPDSPGSCEAAVRRQERPL